MPETTTQKTTKATPADVIAQVTAEKPPRPVAVWAGGTILYVIAVVLLSRLLDQHDPDPKVFPPLLTAMAGLFVATAINVQPGPLDVEEAEWSRFQRHAIVVAILSMVFSIGLVMTALAFPGEEVARLAFWGSAIAILIGAAFLLSTVWNRLGSDDHRLPPAPAAPEASGEEPGPEPRRAPQTALVVETLKETKPQKQPKKAKKSSRTKPKDKKKKK